MHLVALRRLLLIALLMPAPAAATIVVDMDIEAMTSEATLIVHGEVVSTQAMQVEGRVVTEVVVAIRETLKRTHGLSKGEEVLVELPGGTVGDLAQMVAGAPTLHWGEEVVLFLWQRNAGAPPRVLGLSQGVFRIRSDEGESVAERDRTGLGLVSRAGHSLRPIASPNAPERLPLSTLLSRVRARLQRPASAP